MSWAKIILTAAFLVALSGCAVFVPDKDLFINDDVPRGDYSPEGKFENLIVGHIRCEIRNGVIKALVFPEVQWLRTWGAVVKLSLTWDERNDLNPGVSVAPSQLFALGTGLAGTAHSTRLETIEFSFSFKELIDEGGSTCEDFQKGVLIQSNLKIGQFIYDKAVIASTGEATSNKPTTPPYSTLQEDITFVVSLGASVTPTWTLTRVTINPTSPFFDATRMQTDDVLITLGPVSQPATPKSQARLSARTEQLHNAALIGSSTAASIQSQTR